MENKLNGRVTMKHNNMLPEATMEVVTPSILHICVLIIKEIRMQNLIKIFKNTFK